MKIWLVSTSAVLCVGLWPEKLWPCPALLTENRCSTEEQCLVKVSIESNCFVTLLRHFYYTVGLWLLCVSVFVLSSLDRASHDLGVSVYG